MSSPLKNKKLLIALSIVVFLILYHTTPFSLVFNPIREPLVALGGKFFNAGSAVRGFSEGLLRGARLSRELRDLELKLSQSESEVARLRYLEEENRQLRSLVSFESNARNRVLFSRVLARNAEFGVNTITIDQGSENGVSEGLPVVAGLSKVVNDPGGFGAGNGVLVGKVRNVFPKSSVVLLATDSESTLAVSFATLPDIQAIAIGNLGMSLRMELIPQDAEIGIGDLVISSSLESRTPEGLVVGRVAQIEYRDGELFQIAELEPVISTANLSLVGIIMPPQE